MPKVVIQTEIDVQSKGAEAKINKLQAGLATLAGLKSHIKLDVEGGDAAAKQLDQIIDKFNSIRKIAGQKVSLSTLGDIQKIGPVIEDAIKTATGKAKTQLLELRDLRNELLRGWQGSVDKVIANRAVSGTVNKRQALSRSANENRDIDQNLAIARQTGDLRKQISLLSQKRDLLQAINRASRTNVHDAEIAKINQEIAALQKKKEAIKGNNKALGEQSGIFSNLKSIASRYLSIYTVANLGKNIAETTGYFQQQQVALEGILGSASKAQSVLNEIKAFAVQSPFQTKELVTYTKQLAAFGVDNDLFPTVKKLADISAGLGVDMNRIILAYGQVKSAAVLRGQELRQFTEAGIPMVDALAKKFTELNGRLVTTGEVFKLISERKVPFEMVASVLSDMTAEGGKFYKMQENITDTMYGQMEKLRDMWTIEMERIGKSGNGFFMGIIKLLQGMIKHGKTLVITFAAAFAAGKLATFKHHLEGIVRLMRMSVKATGPWGMAFTVAMGAIAAIWTTIDDRVKKVNRAMKEINTSFNKETTKMTSGFDKLVSKLQGATIGTKAYNEALSSLKANYGDYLNDTMIESLVKQKKGWEDIAESVKESIREVQNYNAALARSEKGAELVRENINKERKWYGRYQGMGAITRDVLFGKDNSFMEHTVNGYNYNDDHRYLLARQDKASELMAMAVDNLMQKEGTTTSELKDEIKLLYIEDENLRRILEEHADEYLSRVKELKEWKDYESNLEQAKNDPRYLVTKAFEETNRKANQAYEGLWENVLDSLGLEKRLNGKESKTYLSPSEAGKMYNPTTWERNRQDSIAQTAYNIAADTTYMHGNDTAIAFINKKWDEIKDQEIEDKLINLAYAFEELGAMLKNDAVLKGRISTLNNLYQESAGIATGEAKQVNERIRDRMRASSEGDYKDFYRLYTASNSNYQERVNKVISDRDEHNKYLATHKRDDGAHAAEYDRYEKELKWLDDLFSNVYALKDKDKKGGAGAGGGWRRMFSDLFSYIKEARAEEKKLVDHSAGLTKELSNQINSEQLQGTAVNAFWESMQKEVASPFENIIKKISEYGIESEVFDTDSLIKKLSEMRAGEIKETETVDYMGVWKDLIKVLNERANELAADPNKKSTVDALKTFAQQMTVEMEKMKGSQVEKLINEQLKELRKLNSSFDAIREKNSMFEGIAVESNYMRANRFIYGNDSYKRYDAVDTTSDQIKKMLELGIGKGIASTGAGEELKNILNGTKLNIRNLAQLNDIRVKLQKEASKMTVNDMEGESEAAKQANFDQFKGVIGQLDNSIKQLSKDLQDEFKALESTTNTVDKNANKFINAMRQYNDSLEVISKAQAGGVINSKEADDKRLKALQDFFDKIAGEIPQWIKTIYGKNNGTTGISNSGFAALQMFDGDLNTKFQRQIGKMLSEKNNAIQDKYDRRRKDYKTMFDMGGIDEESYKKALEGLDSSQAGEMQAVAGQASAAMSQVSGVIAMIDTIVKAIYGAIKGILEFIDHITQAVMATQHRLRLEKQENGSYVDENGNIGVNEGYYAMDDYVDKQKEVMNMIQTYNQHAMDGWEKLKNGDVVGSFFEIANSVTDLIRDIAAFEDKDKQQQQDKLIRANERLERAMEKLADVLKDAAGVEKFDVNTDQLANLEKQKANYQALLRLENDKKNGDDEKAQEFADKYQQAQYQINDIIRNINQSILGTADELSKKLTDALTGAFMNGKNAAREWRDAVREYMGEVLRNILIANVIAPRLKKIMEKYGIKEGETNSDKIIAKFSDASAMTQMRNELFAESTRTLDDIANLSNPIKEMMFWNNNTSELTGGIQGITEDTARTLEGLANSILAQHVITNRTCDEISGITQAQLGELKNVVVQQKAIRSAVESIEGFISGRSVMTRPLRVQVE